MNRSNHRTRTAAAVVALALTVASCSTGGGSDSSDATTTADDKTTADDATTTTEAEATTTTDAATPDPEPDEDIPGGVTMVGDKSVLLDGFAGVEIPTGWSITSAEVPVFSTSPPEGETELDPDALTQSLVINPDDDPMGASFALVHYEHSDSVPDLDLFSEAITELLSGDGSQIGDPSEANIGGQDAQLYQVRSASGANGVLVTFESGGEYFFIISIVTDTSYSDDAGAMLASVSFVPEALHD